ncbi:universal stress protein [Nocardia concava]|uniref:universal stress protein n=1 Tax=Nocardia concava TaxID=257281 RepID=UPI000316EF5C|nr:universal stress protein [Nocardia concava]
MDANVSPASLSARSRPVIAGIDGSPAALRAAEWAAAEAAARRVPLRLVAIVPAVDKPAFRPGGGRYRQAVAALEKARRAVLARDAGADEELLEIAVEVRRGQADQVLLDLSWSAELIVLGSTEIGFFSHMVLGSTALTVTREARCPVALVRPAAAARGSVLVVVSDWASAKPALSAALRAAHDRGTDLIVARVWPGRPWSGISDWAAAEPLVSDAQIRHCQQDFPDVAFRPVTVVGDVVTAIERFSALVQLIVVTHHVDELAPARLRRPTQDLVCHSSCPVLVLRDEPASLPRSEASNR